MAEDDDSVSDRKSAENQTNNQISDNNTHNSTKPDIGLEDATTNNTDNSSKTCEEAKSSTSNSSGSARKDENPFSFRHFLKRDLSLPGTSTYENTGARPKVYANTVQHSPNKLDLNVEPRKEKIRSSESQAKDRIRESNNPHLSDHTISSTSVDVPYNLVNDSDSMANLYTSSTESKFYPRPNIASESLGMPSLPDFVQDHILVEQAYLNTNGPISVDLDNLPDFTFNTNYDKGSPSWGRRNSVNRNYDYDSYGASTSDGHPERIPLDLPSGLDGAGAIPLDLPLHLNLDLTESVNPADRRNNSPNNTFPLDLPPNAGVEAMRLPDFLPVHPGRTSPEPEHHDEQLQQILSELERTRSELFAERTRRSRVESELAAARLSIEHLQVMASRAQAEEAAAIAKLNEARSRDSVYVEELGAAAQDVSDSFMDAAARVTDAESTVNRLRNQIRKLKEELACSQEEVRNLRNVQTFASKDLRHATDTAEKSLKELLAGLEHLKFLSASLDPT